MLYQLGDAVQRLRDNKDRYTSVVNFLREQVHIYAGSPAPSVVDKEHYAPSGDPQDYCSLARYWWPADDSQGPWQQRDGQTNPMTQDPAYTDRGRLDQFCQRVLHGTLAWAVLDIAQGADLAVDALRTWFLDPNRSMNPHLQFAQAIPGIRSGRGLGIIDTRGFIDCCEAVELLHGHGHVSAADYQAIKEWFARFTEWLVTSDLGAEEAAAPNNHAIWHDAQIFAYAAFIQRGDLIDKFVGQFSDVRLNGQIADDGHMPHEAKRSLSWFYHGFTLYGFLRCAHAGQAFDQNWFAHDRLQDAITFLAQFDPHSTTWPWQQIGAVAKPDFLMAAAALLSTPNLAPDVQNWARSWINQQTPPELLCRWPVL